MVFVVCKSTAAENGTFFFLNGIDATEKRTISRQRNGKIRTGAQQKEQVQQNKGGVTQIRPQIFTKKEK